MSTLDRPNPGPQHERRRELLDALAVLSGCTGLIPGELPDGRRPDVLRFDLIRRRAFIGEAKDTERPGDRSTMARLAAYVEWALAASRRGSARMAVCHRPGSEAAWLAALRGLIGSAAALGGSREIDDEASVTWVDIPAAPPLPVGHKSRNGQAEHSGALAWHTSRPSRTKFTWSE